MTKFFGHKEQFFFIFKLKLIVLVLEKWVCGNLISKFPIFNFPIIFIKSKAIDFTLGLTSFIDFKTSNIRLLSLMKSIKVITLLSFKTFSKLSTNSFFSSLVYLSNHSFTPSSNTLLNLLKKWDSLLI